MPSGTYLTENARRIIVGLWNIHHNLDVVATKMHISRTTVYNQLTKSNIKLTKMILGEEETQEIIAEYQAGKSAAKIAHDRNLVHKTVCDYLRRYDIKIRGPSESRRQYKLNEKAFDNAEHNPEAAYWCGFLIADCGINLRKSGQACISLALATKDREHIEKFRKFLKADNPVKFYTRTNPLPQDRRSPETYQYAHLTITSKQLVASLARYGILPRKSLTAQVKHLENDPHFWRGCVDGDGSLGLIKSRRNMPIICLVGSKVLINQFANFISLTLGDNRPSVLPNKSIWSVRVAGEKAVRLIKVLYEGCSVALERKLIIAQEAMQWQRCKTDRSDWTIEKLDKLRKIHGTWNNVAKFLGVSMNSVQLRYSYLKCKEHKQ